MVTQEKYLNPYTDFGFKKIFGTEANKELLIDFLNQLITEHGRIKDLTYLPAEKLGKNIDDRKAVYDIYCENEKGEKFIVEMQKSDQDYFKDRSVFYSTFPIQEQAQAGRWNYELKAVYFVGILDFVFDENKDDVEFFHHEVKLVDTKTQKVFYDKLTYIYLEMPKFTKTEAELKTMFDKWLYVLKSLPAFQSRPKILREHVFKKLFHIAELANLTREETRIYEESLKIYRDNYAVMTTAVRKSKQEGKAEGLVEGLAKGLVEGLAKGKAEGLAEATRKIALNLLKKGLSIEDVAETTGLTPEEIKTLNKYNFL